MAVVIMCPPAAFSSVQETFAIPFQSWILRPLLKENHYSES